MVTAGALPIGAGMCQAGWGVLLGHLPWWLQAVRGGAHQTRGGHTREGLHSVSLAHGFPGGLASVGVIWELTRTAAHSPSAFLGLGTGWVGGGRGTTPEESELPGLWTLTTVGSHVPGAKIREKAKCTFDYSKHLLKGKREGSNDRTLEKSENKKQESLE